MARSRTVFVAFLMVLVAPAASAQLANEPPDYFVDVQFEQRVWHEKDDGAGGMQPVAGPMAYVYNPTAQIGLMATWHTTTDPDVDELNFLIEDPMEPEGFRLLESRSLPLPFQGHDFTRQWMEMNWDYLVIGGWSPTLNDHLVLVYTHSFNPAATPPAHSWFLTFDFSEPASAGAPSVASMAWTQNVPTDDLALFEDHVCWAGGGSVRCFWDDCATLDAQVFGTVEANVNPVGAMVPPPAGPVQLDLGATSGFSKGRCWVEETILGGPFYTTPQNVAIRFWQSGGNLYLIVMDPLADNGPDPGNTLRDLPKGDFRIWQHNPQNHQWSQLPLPAPLTANMPHDSDCMPGAGWGGCYHYKATTVGGAALAAVGDYVMVVETKESALTDWQMAHFYSFNSTNVFQHHSFTNITMLFQGTFEHVVRSEGSATGGEVLFFTKEFHQEPFTKKPFFLEEFQRFGALHNVEFDLVQDPPSSALVGALEDTPNRHYTTCSEVDVVRPTGNLFHAIKTENPATLEILVSFAYEDNLTKDGQLYRDNRDPSVPHPYLNDIEKLYNFRVSGSSDCDLYLCDTPEEECELGPPPEGEIDHRDRGTRDGARTGDNDDRDRSNQDADDDDTTGDNDDTGDDDGVQQTRPQSSFPVDEDGDGVPENEVPNFPVDNCPGEYNPVDASTGEQPACQTLATDGSGGDGKGGRSEEIQESQLRPSSKLGSEAWVAMAIGLVLVLLVFLVAKRRNDDEDE